MESKSLSEVVRRKPGRRRLLTVILNANAILLALLSTTNPAKAASSWTEVTGLLTTRNDLAAGVLNGALYAMAGRSGGNAQTNVYRYDGTNWSGVSGLSSARYAMAVGVWNGALYAVGGRNASHNE